MTILRLFSFFLMEDEYMFVKEVKDEVAIKLTDLLKARLNTLLQDNWESLVFLDSAGGQV